MRPPRTAAALGAAAAALFAVTSLSLAPAASADCTNAGGAYVCAQGTVRGGGPTPPTAGPYYPSYCPDPWYCGDDWGLDIIIDPGPGRPGGGRPGGIGPR